MLESDVDRLLIYSLQLKPYKPPMYRSEYAARIYSISKFVIFVSIMLFVAMCLLALLIYFDIDSSREIKFAGKILGISSMLFAVVFLLLNTVADSMTILRVSKDFHKDVLEQKNHDIEAAKKVLNYSLGTVEYARKVIELKLKRFDNRLAEVFGSSDKVALFSLGGMGWGIYKESGNIGKVFSELPTMVPYVLYGALAFIFGACIAAIAIRMVSAKCRYALEIFELSDLLRDK